MNYLKLIRWKNIIMIVALMAIIRLFVFEKGLENSGLLFTLQFPQSSFWILVLSVVLIAIGGNVVNDIYDQEIDNINKPDKKIVNTHISETAAWIIYFVVTISGIALGYYLALQQNNTSFTLFHLITPALLWIYAAQLKKSPLLGNIAIALLAACVPLLQLTFEYSSMLAEYWQIIELNAFGNPLLFMLEWSFYLTVFAFLSTLIRELVKDMEDIEGDKRFGARTLAVIAGIGSVKKITLVLCVLFIALLYGALFYLSIFHQNTLIYVVYQTIALTSLAIYGMVKLLKAEDKKDFTFLSQLWKIVMLAGFGTCVLYGLL